MPYVQVDRALGALPVRLRECLAQRELEELSYKDIAQIAGVPIELKRSCPAFRARQALARMGATTAAALGRGTGGATLSAAPPAAAIGCGIGAVTGAEVAIPSVAGRWSRSKKRQPAYRSGYLNRSCGVIADSARRSGSSRRCRSGRSRTASPAAVFPLPRGRNAGSDAEPLLPRWAGDEARRRAKSALPALAQPPHDSQVRPLPPAERGRAG
jgi:hypothetical protein